MNRQKKKKLRDPIRPDFDDISEDDAVDPAGEQRGDQQPQRAEDGLFIGENECFFRQQNDQIPIAPQLSES